MNTPIKYRKIKQGDAIQVFTFIKEVFNQFVAPGFAKAGIEAFLKYIRPDALDEYLSSNHFGYVGLVDSEIVGVIILRDYNHVALFFVASEYQQQGVGRALFQSAVEECKSNGENIITVNASPNSTNAYKKLNFEPTDNEQCVDGIRFVPMAFS